MRQLNRSYDDALLTEEECYLKIRNYDPNKRKVIQDVFKFLHTHSSFITIK